MTKKQYLRKMEFLKGYRQGYKYSSLPKWQLSFRSADYKRGYSEGRKDRQDGEAAAY